MDYNSQGYYRSALKLKLPVVECDATFGIKVTLGSNIYHFFDRVTPCNNSASTYACINKFLANGLLREAGIPVPKARALRATNFNIDSLIEASAHLKFPLVVKPMIMSGTGNDVVCNIPTVAALFEQCEILLKKYPWVLLEEYHGHLLDYRVLVFKNKILDVVARFPASVVGNGTDTIMKLVELKNEERLKTSSLLKPIVLDYEASLCLINQGLTAQSIPEMGTTVSVGYTCNTTRGGDIKSISTKMCKENKKLFSKIAKVLNLELMGIDVRCKTMLEPIITTKGVIIEVNDTPSIRIHEEGVGGPPKYVTKTILKSFIYKHPISYLIHLCKLFKYRILTSIVILLAILFPSALLLYYTFHR